MVGVLPSVANECSGDSCKNVISMPLMDDMKATLKADLDVTNMNNHLKAYIEQEIQKGVETAMKDVMRQLIDNKLEQANATIEATVHEELTRIGVTYVRWGRKGCPDGAELVYTGQAGGNYYNNEGGGVNNLCLPNDPENGEHQNYDNSQVYGAEYNIDGNRKPHGMSGNLRYKAVPCAVCHRKQRSSILIVPEAPVPFGSRSWPLVGLARVYRWNVVAMCSGESGSVPKVFQNGAELLKHPI
ncbi:unnamed protein product [Mytilus edulis]|uniref:Uncharacterized protein n=1 Tax=Mytilus edulis TaxID=6550 RepID=A0A8S3TFG6_MYTED|nr:unnamed protein product [Mytilus edulis]